MNNIIRLTCLTVLLACLPAYADSPAPEMVLIHFDQVIKDCLEQLDIWRSKYHVQVGAAILVIVLGLVAAALQGLANAKVWTVILGLVISSITAAVNVLEMNNYRQISAKIERVEGIVRQMKTQRSLYAANKDADVVEEFRLLRKRYLAIVDPPDREPEKEARVHVSLSPWPVAYAADLAPPPPAWLQQLPSNPKNLYFVGVADNARLPDAQTESVRTAKAAATQFLLETVQTSIQSTGAQAPMLDVTSIAADEIDNYVTFDETSGRYRYYSLVRVNKLQTQSNTRFEYLKKGLDDPAVYTSIGDAPNQNSVYAAQRLRLQEQQIDQTLQQLSAQQYKMFSDARQARLSSTPQDAIPLLKEIVAQKPDFYLGWFNLALAYSKARDEPSARQAYERAVALEPSQPLRDSSIYNTYGHFLLERHEYCASSKQLEQALSLAPQNTLAQRNLEKARRDMQQRAIECP